MGQTLKELDVQVGDVVNHGCGDITIVGVKIGYSIGSDGKTWGFDNPIWTLVSRATPPIDLTAITTPFGLLDEATQQALLDDGGPYEVFGSTGHWVYCDEPSFFPSLAWRKKPAPKVETVVLTGFKICGHWVFSQAKTPKDTHTITMTLTDGIPDPVAKVEALK